jgi:hypothetical protein
MHMVRYADDFIITGNSKEWLEHEVKPAVVAFLAERGLVLSPVKTKVTHIDEGFDFLGWNIRVRHEVACRSCSYFSRKEPFISLDESTALNKERTGQSNEAS